MFRVTVLGEVLEPESIGDPHQGEAGGDDHEAFVAHRGAVWSLVLVGPAPVQHSLVKTAKNECLIYPPYFSLSGTIRLSNLIPQAEETLWPPKKLASQHILPFDWWSGELLI